MPTVNKHIRLAEEFVIEYAKSDNKFSDEEIKTIAKYIRFAEIYLRDYGWNVKHAVQKAREDFLSFPILNDHLTP